MISGRSALWIFIFVFWLVSTIFLFYIGPTSEFLYTYQLGNPPGALFSQRWSYEFFLIGSLVLVWSVPITLAFAMESPESSTRYRLTIHLIVVIFFLMWFAAGLFYNSFLWSKANQNTPDNYLNPFNSPAFCCVYHVSAQAYCFNRVDCAPNPQPSDLVTNGAALFMWSYLLILLVFLGLDLGMVFTILKPSYDMAEITEMGETPEEALLENEIPMPKTRVRAYRARKQ